MPHDEPSTATSSSRRQRALRLRSSEQNRYVVSPIAVGTGCSAALGRGSTSMTTIRPFPHAGQHRLDSGTASAEATIPTSVFASVCGASGTGPRSLTEEDSASSLRQSDTFSSRCRFASNPKCRMRTKPLGITCCRNRRTNSTPSSVMTFLVFPSA